MKLRTLWRSAAAALAVTSVAACEDLTVQNEQNPDVARAYATAEGIEAIIRGGFNQILGATHAVSAAIQPGAMVISMENYASVANFGMNLRAALPRDAAVIDNNLGNPTAAENNRDFTQLSLRGRTVSNAVKALDELTATGGTLLATAGADSDAGANARARSFGFFVVALANGEMALAYDSVGVIRPAQASDEIPALSGYMDAMNIALGQLDSAINITTAAVAAGNTFTIPGAGTTAWFRTGNAITTAEYVRILRSVKARFRAGVARNPAQRAAVNWDMVVADAANGITSDITFDLNANEGWSNVWLNQAMLYTGWSEAPPYYIGMADTSSNYASWLSVQRGDRVRFLILTPDQRFPQGSTRAAQQTNSPASTVQLPSVYFRNRPTGEDTPGEAWGNSMYDHVRFRSYRQLSQTGPWVWMDKTEIDMLRAEGLMRLGRASEAVPLVNLTRVANGLPAFPAGATMDTRAPSHPGGSATSCVPRTPTGAGNAIECGTLFEAMKWEKRLETQFTGWLQWYQDSRGWGDLPIGSVVMWPVPYQEMQARSQPYYNGPPQGKQNDPEWKALTSTYGFGVGSR